MRLTSLCSIALASAPAAADDRTPADASTESRPADDEHVRTKVEAAPKQSLSTSSTEEAWRTAGFRLSLAMGYGELAGLDGAPSGRLIGAIVRAGLRLDADWSLSASLHYALASRPRQLEGLRFAGTIDPTWHVTPWLALVIGLGFGGIVEGSTDRMEVEPLPSTLDTSYTFDDARTPLPSCSGVGLAALTRAEYSRLLGPRAALTIGLEVVGQYTQCVQSTGRVEPDTARPIERRQFWPHVGAHLVIGVTWR